MSSIISDYYDMGDDSEEGNDVIDGNPLRGDGQNMFPYVFEQETDVIIPEGGNNSPNNATRNGKDLNRLIEGPKIGTLRDRGAPESGTSPVLASASSAFLPFIVALLSSAYLYT